MARKPVWPPLAPSKDPSDYSAFPGAISRGTWRIIFQRLTSAGRWCAAVTAMLIAYGGISHYIPIYVVAIDVAAIWVVAFLAMLFFRPRVRLTARCSHRICAGENLRVDLNLDQRSRLRGADLVIVPHRLPDSIDAIPLEGLRLGDVRRGEQTRCTLILHCGARGTFTLPGFRVETDFPFGILRARQVFADPQNLVVYPRFFPLGRLELPTGRRYQPGGVALVSELGESFEYLGNREYRDGDNVRDMDWRATARAQRPIVREWIEEYMLRAAVILDTHIPDPPRTGGGAVRGLFRSRKNAPDRKPAFERAISVAAAVSDFMARQDYLVDLFAAGPNLYHLTAGRSLAYLDQILDILACVEESPQEPFGVIEPQIAELLERLSTVICVFLDWNQTRRDFAMRMQSRGVAVKIIICRDGPCTADPAGAAGLFGAIPTVSQAEFESGISEL